MSAGLSAGAIAGISAGVGAAGNLASGFLGSDAAEGAAGLQSEYLDLGINELRGALDPSMERLDAAQNWSDRYLRQQFNRGMRDTDRYHQAGAQGLNALNYRLGLDNGIGPAPTAPTAPKAPKPPKYDKDPTKAAAQKKAYDKLVKQYGRQQAQFQIDSQAHKEQTADWQARTAAAEADPNFGGLMDPYGDRFEGRIDEVAKRTYNDKYANEILETARDKFDAADFEVDPGYEFRRSEGNRGVEQSAAAGGSLQSGATLKALTRFNQDTASNEFDRAHGRWVDQHNRHLAGVTGQQAHDYNVFDRQKGTELETLVNQRNFDEDNWQNNRDFQYGALTGQVAIGQDAVDDRNQLRQWGAGQRTQNRLNTAQQQGNWQQNTANNIAEFLAQQGNAQAAGEVGSANAWSSGLQGAGNALGTAAGYFFGNGRRGNGLVHRTPPAAYG